MGEILRDAPKNEGTKGQLQGRDASGPSVREGPEDTSTPTLSELGVTYKQSSRAQKLAEVSDEQFEALISIVQRE